jgi:hypothetical protein
VRLGGTNDPDNLVMLAREDHAKAHLALFLKYGGHRDLCAYHMILGRARTSRDDRLAAAAAGGRASQVGKRARGDLNGFQAFSEHKRRVVAAKAGRISGAKQRDLGLGIHGLSPARASEIGAMGGRASCGVNGWRTSEVQSANGKKGGPKNKGFRWYGDGAKTYKYTAKQQADISFEGFLAANPQFQKGR